MWSVQQNDSWVLSVGAQNHLIKKENTMTSSSQRSEREREIERVERRDSIYALPGII
jgi:hypothetical protein